MMNKHTWISSGSAKATVQTGLGLLLAVACSWALGLERAPQLGENQNENETEFVFGGRCAGGQVYRFELSTQKRNGQTQQVYDYQGPQGKGRLVSEQSPRQMKAFLCQEPQQVVLATEQDSCN